VKGQPAADEYLVNPASSGEPGVGEGRTSGVLFEACNCPVLRVFALLPERGMSTLYSLILADVTSTL